MSSTSLWIQPGNCVQQKLKAYEEQIGKIKLQQLPSDNSIQTEGISEVLREQEKISLFRSIVGPGIYPCQERYDVAPTVKESASRMSNPTAMSFHHLKKFLGYLKMTLDYLVVEFPQAGEGYVKKGESYWRLTTVSLRFRLGWKQEPQKINFRRTPCIEQLSIAYLHVKQSCAQ